MNNEWILLAISEKGFQLYWTVKINGKKSTNESVFNNTEALKKMKRKMGEVFDYENSLDVRSVLSIHPSILYSFIVLCGVTGVSEV